MLVQPACVLFRVVWYSPLRRLLVSPWPALGQLPCAAPLNRKRSLWILLLLQSPLAVREMPCERLSILPARATNQHLLNGRFVFDAAPSGGVPLLSALTSRWITDGQRRRGLDEWRHGIRALRAFSWLPRGHLLAVRAPGAGAGQSPEQIGREIVANERTRTGISLTLSLFSGTRLSARLSRSRGLRYYPCGQTCDQRVQGDAEPGRRR